VSAPAVRTPDVKSWRLGDLSAARARGHVAAGEGTVSFDALGIPQDLRYWSARRGNAQVRSPGEDIDSVQFGRAVTILRQSGRRQSFRIVGEDEADPAKGSISYVSPLPRALLGKTVGDSVRAGNEQAEITAIDDYNTPGRSDLGPVD
jgi:transcription elongation GreA/GreB family factor